MAREPRKIEHGGVGTLWDKGTPLFLRVACGTASDSAGVAYTMSTSAGSGSPIVRHERTGRMFLLSWADIIALAEEAGIAED